MKGRFSPQAPDDAQLRDSSLKSLDTANQFANVEKTDACYLDITVNSYYAN